MRALLPISLLLAGCAVDAAVWGEPCPACEVSEAEPASCEVVTEAAESFLWTAELIDDDTDDFVEPCDGLSWCRARCREQPRYFVVSLEPGEELQAQLAPGRARASAGAGGMAQVADPLPLRLNLRRVADAGACPASLGAPLERDDRVEWDWVGDIGVLRYTAPPNEPMVAISVDPEDPLWTDAEVSYTLRVSIDRPLAAEACSGATEP